jgi:nitroimidazol reductase NimA-like FMN-containing flavoprotein (pyridoxamine 5'-phosphate oxidase superfamily)
MTSRQLWDRSKVRELDPEECRRLLRMRTVGRLAFADDSGPDVLPVNYVTDGEDLLVATSAYSAMARSATGARVAFEIDDTDDYTRSGWSVVVRGRATHEAPPRAVELPWSWAEGTHSYVLRIHPDVVTGRRLVPS